MKLYLKAILTLSLFFCLNKPFVYSLERQLDYDRVKQIFKGENGIYGFRINKQLITARFPCSGINKPKYAKNKESKAKSLSMVTDDERSWIEMRVINTDHRLIPSKETIKKLHDNEKVHILDNLQQKDHQAIKLESFCFFENPDNHSYSYCYRLTFKDGVVMCVYTDYHAVQGQLIALEQIAIFSPKQINTIEDGKNRSFFDSFTITADSLFDHAS